MKKLDQASKITLASLAVFFISGMLAVGYLVIRKETSTQTAEQKKQVIRERVDGLYHISKFAGAFRRNPALAEAEFLNKICTIEADVLDITKTSTGTDYAVELDWAEFRQSTPPRVVIYMTPAQTATLTKFRAIRFNAFPFLFEKETIYFDGCEILETYDNNTAGLENLRQREKQK